MDVQYHGFPFLYEYGAPLGGSSVAALVRLTVIGSLAKGGIEGI